MSQTDRITVYAAVDSPFPHRVVLALEEAKANYDIIWIDLLNKPDWYEKKVYPIGKVPYLVYGGPELHPDESPSPSATTISESLIIMEFIADLFPSANLLPKDPVLRAKARLFVQTVDTKLIPAFAGFIFQGAPLDHLLSVLEALQRTLPSGDSDQGGGYALGEWSIADAALVPVLLRLRDVLALKPFTIEAAELERAVEAQESPRFARLMRYLKENETRPSMAKTWHKDVVTEKFKQRIERLAKTAGDKISVPQKKN